MKVALIGINGQLSSDLASVLRNSHEVIGFTHRDIEVSDYESVRSALLPTGPEAVINTAAFHKVDDVEDNPARAFAVNATGPRNLALICQELAIPLVHLSTDYVFSGQKGAPYTEHDPADPINIYGVSKAAGEMTLRYLWPQHIIIRTSGLYGKAGSSGKGGNFMELMLRLAQEGKPIRVVNDQTLTPTSTLALASQIAVLIQERAYGTFHATCQGACSWYEFAEEIFSWSGLRTDLSPQSTAQSGARARRPPYSVLENADLKRLGIDVMPHWRDALHNYLVERQTRIERSPESK